MKMISCLKMFVSSLIACAAVSAAHAQVIGIDFYNGSPTDQTISSSDVAGPYASAGWYNQVNPSTAPGPMSLLDSNNAATGATFGFTQGGNTLSGNPIYNSGYSVHGSDIAGLTPDQLLYNGAVGAVASNWSQELVLQNIPYAVYNVYLMVDAPRVAGDTPNIIGSVQNFDGGVVSGAGTTYYFENTTTGNNTPDTFIPNALTYMQATGTTLGTATIGANYIEFTGLTNPNETFDLLNVTAGNQSYTNDVTLGAIEIVNAAVPEPGTVWSVAFGAFALLVIGFKRRGRFA